MQSRVWIRDLTEEGIEPHPGPRYITKNINEGMATPNACNQFFTALDRYPQVLSITR
jgi:hypothetical protein